MRITHLRLLAGAATAALLTGVLATPAPAAPAPAARANYQVPKVGSCHLVTQKQADAPADGRTPVSCASKHTTVTIAVKRLTEPVDWRNTNALYRKIQRKCRNAVETTLGRSDLLRSQTAYDWFWFMPTRGQRTRGAKWLRCDLGLDRGSRLMPLAADVRLPSVLTDRVRRCLTPRGAWTVCTRDHAYRSVGAFRISGGYPGEKRARRLAIRRCDRFVTTRTWWYTYPSRDGWRACSRAMVCYKKTRR